jgi:rsbT co-antagonist protein RsbR
VTTTDLSIEQLTQEIAELKRKNAELQQQIEASQADQRTDAIFFEHAIDLLSIIDFDGHFKRVNPAWTKQLGYTEEELFSQPFINFVHPDDHEQTIKVTSDLINSSSNLIAFENRYRHKDGTYRTLQWNCTSDCASQQIYSIAIDVTERNLAQKERAIYATSMEHLPNSLAIYRLVDPEDPRSLIMVAANKATQQYYPGEGSLLDRLGERLIDIYPEITVDSLLKPLADVALTGKPLHMESGSIDDPHPAVFSILAFPLPDNHVGVLYDNITERKLAERAQLQNLQQEEIIRAQKAALEELSTPLIPITDKIVVMPLIGSMDSRRAQQVMDTLLHGVAETKATNVILDITGVSVVDTQVANTFIRAAQAVKLLGAQVMITGIRPEVAQTLIGLGVDLSEIVTSSSLQVGIATAFSKQ